MKYPVTFLLLGAALVFLSRSVGYASILCLWGAANCAAVGISYLLSNPIVFGKRKSGKMNPACVLLMLPFLLLTWSTWHTMRALSRENASDSLNDNLTIGRRLLGSEFNSQFENIVDLTAEFNEPNSIIQASKYHSFPILDASTVAAPKLKRIAEKIDAMTGSVYIHCAQGHGRTGMVTAALLMHRDAGLNADEALHRIRAVRPLLSCNHQQRATLEQLRNE